MRKKYKLEAEALLQTTKDEGRLDESGEVVKAMLPTATGTRGGKGAKKDSSDGELFLLLCNTCLTFGDTDLVYRRRFRSRYEAKGQGKGKGKGKEGQRRTFR